MQGRCADFFEEDVEYIDFLAQPMSRQQKQALLRTPAALPFLNRRPADAAGEFAADDTPVATDGEDEFIQRLLDPIRNGGAQSGQEFYTRLLDEVSAKSNGDYAFSAKARGWAEYYRAVLAEQVDGPGAGRPAFEKLAASFDEMADSAYPDALRLLTADALATSYARDKNWTQAAAAYAEAANRARRTEDTERLAAATRQAADCYRQFGRVDRVIELYEEATSGEDIPAGIKAEFLISQATLLCHLGDYAAALEPIHGAVRIWRLRSLDIDGRTAQLISAQVLGLHCFVQTESRDEARKWLGRVRSTLARVTPEELSPEMQERLTALSNLESAAMMVQQGRWNHAWKNLTSVERWLDADDAPAGDADEHALLRQRIRLLKTEVCLRRGETTQALTIADEILAHDAMADAVRDKGQHARIWGALAGLLDSSGEQQASQKALTVAKEALDPNGQASEAVRALCGLPQITALRESLA